MKFIGVTLLVFLTAFNAYGGYADCDTLPLASNEKSNQLAVLALCNASYIGPNAWESTVEIFDIATGKELKSIKLQMTEHADEEISSNVESFAKKESKQLAIQALSKGFEIIESQPLPFKMEEAISKMGRCCDCVWNRS